MNQNWNSVAPPPGFPRIPQYRNSLSFSTEESLSIRHYHVNHGVSPMHHNSVSGPPPPGFQNMNSMPPPPPPPPQFQTPLSHMVGGGGSSVPPPIIYFGQQYICSPVTPVPLVNNTTTTFFSGPSAPIFSNTSGFASPAFVVPTSAVSRPVHLSFGNFPQAPTVRPQQFFSSSATSFPSNAFQNSVQQQHVTPSPTAMNSLSTPCFSSAMPMQRQAQFSQRQPQPMTFTRLSFSSSCPPQAQNFQPNCRMCSSVNLQNQPANIACGTQTYPYRPPGNLNPLIGQLDKFVEADRQLNGSDKSDDSWLRLVTKTPPELCSSESSQSDYEDDTDSSSYFRNSSSDSENYEDPENLDASVPLGQSASSMNLEAIKLANEANEVKPRLSADGSDSDSSESSHVSSKASKKSTSDRLVKQSGEKADKTLSMQNAGDLEFQNGCNSGISPSNGSNIFPCGPDGDSMLNRATLPIKSHGRFVDAKNELWETQGREFLNLRSQCGPNRFVPRLVELRKVGQEVNRENENFGWTKNSNEKGVPTPSTWQDNNLGLNNCATDRRDYPVRTVSDPTSINVLNFEDPVEFPSLLANNSNNPSTPVNSSRNLPSWGNRSKHLWNTCDTPNSFWNFQGQAQRLKVVLSAAQPFERQPEDVFRCASADPSIYSSHDAMHDGKINCQNSSPYQNFAAPQPHLSEGNGAHNVQVGPLNGKAFEVETAAASIGTDSEMKSFRFAPSEKSNTQSESEANGRTFWTKLKPVNSNVCIVENSNEMRLGNTHVD